MSLVAHQEGDFFLFHLFGVVSGTLQLLLACYGLFRVVLFFTSNDVTEYYDLQIYYESTSFYYTGFQALLQSGTAYSRRGITNWDRHYKAGQLLFKSGAIIIK